MDGSAARRGARRAGARWLRERAKRLERQADRWERDPISRPREDAPAGRIGKLFFALSALVYLASRFLGLERFPIYFFCDEAVNGVSAGDLVRHGLRDTAGHLLPTYFVNGGVYNLSASVYAQIPARLLFPTSVFAARATAVLVAFSGAIAVERIVSHVFRRRFGWTGILLLGATPAWFIHSRTVFETAMAASFYAWFLYGYLRYRDGHSRGLGLAVVAGALAFYTYSPMQLVVPVSVLLFAAADLPFHWRNRRVAALGLAGALVLALPQARALRAHPDDTPRHLAQLFSYWGRQDLGVGQKVGLYAREYAAGFSPRYWFVPEQARDLPRHRFRGLGHLLPWTAPFLAAGLLLCVVRFRSAPYRTVLLALLAAPAGAALARVTVTRALVLVVPAAIATAIGLDRLLAPLARRIPEAAVALIAFLPLAAANATLLHAALAHGPTWYRDYGIHGMQYGARQVFGEVRRRLAAGSAQRFEVSPIWANGTDSLQRFFLPGEKRVQLHDIRWFSAARRNLEGTVVVLTPNEYATARRDPRFVAPGPDAVLPFPDGTPGFYFLRLRNAPDFEERVAEERARRHALVRETFADASEILEVAHSRLDIGQLRFLFDGDPSTLTRTASVNPAVFEISFRSPRPLRAVVVTTGRMDFCLSARVRAASGRVAKTVREFSGLPGEPVARVSLEPPVEDATSVRLEIENFRAGDDENIHVREIRFEPAGIAE